MPPATPDLASHISPFPIGDQLPPDTSGYEAFGTRSRLRVRACADISGLRGQAFWDVQEEVISYHIVPHQPYDSYVQGERFRIDTDSDGKPVFLELQWDPCKHLTVNELVPPIAVPGGVRLLDLRIRFHERSIVSTRDHAITYMGFGGVGSTRNFFVSTGLICCLDADDFLSSLWIVGAISDPNGRIQSQWRADAWRAIRKQQSVQVTSAGVKLSSPASVPKVY